MPHLPKQRGQTSNRLSRQDLPPRVPSSHMEDFDFDAAAVFSASLGILESQVPYIPVYNRDRNTIRRFSRNTALSEGPRPRPTSQLTSYYCDIDTNGADEGRAICSGKNPNKTAHVQIPDFSKLPQCQMTPRAVAGPTTYDNGEASMQDAESTDNDWMVFQSKQTTQLQKCGKTAQVEIRSGPFQPQLNLHQPLLKTTQMRNETQSFLSPMAKRDSVQEPESLEVVSRTRLEDRNKRQSTFSLDFPRFVPQFQQQFRIHGGNRLQNSNHFLAPKSAQSQGQETLDGNTMASAETSASNRFSTFGSQCSVRTGASSETESLSVDIFLPENSPSLHGKKIDAFYHQDKRIAASSVYEASDALSSHQNQKNLIHELGSLETQNLIQTCVLSDQCVDESVPPEPPKHQHRPLSHYIPGTKSGSPLAPRKRRQSLNFCLDLGAGYDESRFMIPAENQIHRYGAGYSKKTIPIHKPFFSVEHDAPPIKTERNSSFSTKRVFAGVKRGFGRIFK